MSDAILARIDQRLAEDLSEIRKLENARRVLTGKAVTISTRRGSGPKRLPAATAPREQVLDAIGRNPGIKLEGLRRELPSMRNAVIGQALRRLRADGVVVKALDGTLIPVEIVEVA